MVHNCWQLSLLHYVLKIKLLDGWQTLCISPSYKANSTKTMIVPPQNEPCTIIHSLLLWQPPSHLQNASKNYRNKIKIKKPLLYHWAWSSHLDKNGDTGSSCMILGKLWIQVLLNDALIHCAWAASCKIKNPKNPTVKPSDFSGRKKEAASE